MSKGSRGQETITLLLLAALASEAQGTSLAVDARDTLECLETARMDALVRYKACSDTEDLIRCTKESTERHLAAVDRCYVLGDQEGGPQPQAPLTSRSRGGGGQFCRRIDQTFTVSAGLIEVIPIIDTAWFLPANVVGLVRETVNGAANVKFA